MVEGKVRRFTFGTLEGKGDAWGADLWRKRVLSWDLAGNHGICSGPGINWRDRFWGGRKEGGALMVGQRT